jgi:hypothetical protein
MTNSYSLSHGFRVENSFTSEWNDDVLERTASALYKWRRPRQSWYCDLHQLDEWTVDCFYRWANEFLNAALPDGPTSEEWYPEDAAKVYYRRSHQNCMYADMEEVRWPWVGHWYESVAESVKDAALRGIPVDNTAVLPMELRALTG